MIVYGWNSYLLKSVSLVELGIITNDTPDTNIEYRQKYFHLFFIPFFPIGRIWVVRQGGKMYDVAPEIKDRLNHVETATKHKIWAWSGLLLALGALLIYNISNSIEEKAYKARMEKDKAVLVAYFKDKARTAPIAQKLTTMNTMVDSSMSSIQYEDKKIDTSIDVLVALYLQAAATRTDSLIGYDEDNTITISQFHSNSDRQEIMNKEYQTSLEAGDWRGYYADTASVFEQIRKLEKYKYILLLKEYNRVDPHVENDIFTSGYSFVKAKILSIETGKLVKEFTVIGGNSDKVNYFTQSNSSQARSDADLARTLEGDLDKNVIKEVNEYVFHKKEF
jgi:hypothetical protein